MTVKEKLLLLGCIMSMGLLIVSPSFSLYEEKDSDLSIAIGVDTETTYSIKFYKFDSSSSTTPTLDSEYKVQSGSKLSSLSGFSIPSISNTLDYYTYQDSWSTSTSFDDSLTSGEVSSQIITSDISFYPIYIGYFAATSSSSSEKVGLSYVSTNTYQSSESTYSSTSYYIYKNIYGSSTYETVSDQKTIYCEAADGETVGKYTFNYNSSTKDTNAIRRFFYQSSNNDFPYGYTPQIHMFANDTGETTTWPGVSMSHVKDLIYDKVFTCDVDATLYKTFIIIKIGDDGNPYKVEYGSYGSEFNFRSGTNCFSYSWSSAPFWSTYPS